MSEISMLDCR